MIPRNAARNPGGRRPAARNPAAAGRAARNPVAPYAIPETPAVGWSSADTRRRAWLGRALIGAILSFQVALTLRLDNTAFQDEALYLYVGRLRLDDGGSLATYADYFSGSPYLYPVAAAAADAVFGLEGARALSLLCMLGTTCLLYGFTSRLFNVRTGSFAAAAFVMLQSTATLGRLATYDAAALFLVAGAVWAVIRFARSRAASTVFTAAPLCVLAFAVKYAAGIFLPAVVCVAVVAAWPHRGLPRALGRGAALLAVTALGVGAFVRYGGVVEGLRFTTTGRAAGTETPWQVLRASAEYGGVFLLVAVLGAVLYTRRERLGEVPGHAPEQWTRLQRAALGLLLMGTGLLVPCYQAYGHTWVALHKHVGYGLLFAAPMVGVGLSRLAGPHLRNPQYGIAGLILLFVLGAAKSEEVFGRWPDSGLMVSVIHGEMRPDGHYLSSVPQVPIYYLGPGVTAPGQWRSTYGFTAFHEVAEGRFDLIVLDGAVEPRVNEAIERAIAGGTRYRLRARLPYDRDDLHGSYKIWVRRG